MTHMGSNSCGAVCQSTAELYHHPLRRLLSAPHLPTESEAGEVRLPRPIYLRRKLPASDICAVLIGNPTEMASRTSPALSSPEQTTIFWGIFWGKHPPSESLP